MKKRKSPLALAIQVATALVVSTSPLPTPAAEKDSDPVLLAHYMPWYASKAVSGRWGWHWTMDHFDPDVISEDGTRQVASHDYPLIGAYDSGDPHALECQVLQMKFAGIDGVIVDWYGIRDYFDYAAVHANTQALVPFLEKAGLRFVICYEDQSIGHMIKGGAIEEKDGIEEARRSLRWVEENWFSHPSYLRMDGQPILIAFGPQHFDEEGWRKALSVFKTKPRVHLLPHLAKRYEADGPFGWPPVYGGKSFAPSQWRESLEELYARADEGEEVMAIAFPGYEDIYEQAGLHPPYGYIDPRGGRTFIETLDRALASSSDIIQIATWNDYGEGTVIEPSRNHGYRYLEEVQERSTGAEANSGKAFEPDDLRLPARLFQLRKQALAHEQETNELDQAADLLFAGEVRQASVLMDKWEASHPGKDAPKNSLGSYQTKTDISYRDGADADDYMRERCRLDVYYPEDEENFSTVVWFHGGGLRSGNRSVPEELERAGIAVVAVDYRLSPKVESPAYVEDAAAAVAWTFRNIERFGGSADRIFVSGSSAGGYLAKMVGLDKSYLAAHEIDADRIAGLISLSGHTITHFTVRKERGIDGKQPIVDEMAPLFHVRKEAPPILLITGDRDLELLGRHEETAYFWRMMKIAGHEDVTLRELDGYDHGGMKSPALPLLLEFVRDHSPPGP